MTDWLRFFVLGPGVGCSAYLVLQVAAAWKLVGTWRIAALVPAPIMLFVGLDAVRAYRADSNLWPLGLIFGGPIAGLYVGLVFLGRIQLIRRSRLRQQTAGAAQGRSGDDGKPA